MSKLTHFDDKGRAQMVDISSKATTSRRAVAQACIQLSPETLALVKDKHSAAFKKGDIFATAEIAGIMAAKHTSTLIPLCHPLPLSHAKLDISLDGGCIKIIAECRTNSQTGVEMEALVAASTAALTLYDMLKAVDKTLTITDIRLLEKSGGKSGHYVAKK